VKLLTVLIMIVVAAVAGCSAGGRFGALNHTAKELEASDADTDRDDFAKLVDQFADELAAAKAAAVSPADQAIVAKYGEALAIWKDSLTLWDAKIGVPNLIEDAGQHADDPIKGGDAASVAAEYQRRAGFMKILATGGVPLASFSNPSDTKLADVAKRYNIPIRFQSGWSYISANSYRTLWPSAAAKIAEADALAKND
jgi:hypothetical protein